MLFNGDGMEVQNIPQAVELELLKGTGSVMADGVSIYTEHLNVSEHRWVVAKSPKESDGTPEIKTFPSTRFDDAWEQFNKWRRE